MRRTLSMEEAVIDMRVIYVPYHANGDHLHKDCERGRITSKNDHYIFVRFSGETSQACLPDQLVRA